MPNIVTLALHRCHNDRKKRFQVFSGHTWAVVELGYQQKACDMTFQEGRFHISSAPKRYRVLLRRSWLLLLIWPLMTALAITAMWRIEYSRRDMELDTLKMRSLREAETLSNAYAKQLVRSLEKLDELTALVEYGWEMSGRTLRLEDLARRGMLTTDHFASFLIIGADGNNLTSTQADALNFNYADRPYFKAHKADVSRELKVSTPTIGRISRKKVIHVTRRITNVDGSFGGVVVVSVANDFFTPLSDDTVFGETGLQAVVGNDGVERVGLIGGVLPTPPLTALKTTASCLPNDLPKLIDGNCFADGHNRYLGSTPFGTYPFSAVVGLSEQQVLKPYLSQQNERTRFLLILSGLLGVGCIFAIVMTAIMLLRRNESEEVRKAYRQATDNGKEGFYLWRKVENKQGLITDFKLVDCNERGAEFYGIKKADLLGRTFLDLYGDTPHRHSMVAKYRGMYQQGVGEENYQIPDASLISCKWQHRKYLRTFEGLALTTADISEQVDHQQELARLVVEDNLTGLPNRRWVTQNLPDFLGDAERTKSLVAILFLDLDDFKDVNDSRGHSFGDSLLRAVSERLRCSVRPSDFVARLGGDEFTIVMPCTNDGEQVEALAQRVLSAMTEPFLIGDVEISVSASVGAAVFPKDGLDTETLLKNADIAMYASKITKGAFTLYSHQLDEARQARRSTELDIANALKNDEFVLYFQPRFRPTTREIVGMEALIRWHHPKRGLVMPNDFIPIAEGSELIVQIGEVVARKVALQVQAWQKLNLTVVPVSLNVSRRQFNHGRVKLLMEQVLNDTGIDPALLQVEITESTIMGENDQVGEQLVALSKLGIKTHVDDFGTGYSSLAMLQEFSLDVLKIDRAFTQALGKSPESEVLFKAVVTMGHALGMDVVAEGVETQAQLDLCSLTGCDEVQGYFLSRPIDANAAARFLTKHSLPLVSQSPEQSVML